MKKIITVHNKIKTINTCKQRMRQNLTASIISKSTYGCTCTQPGLEILSPLVVLYISFLKIVSSFFKYNCIWSNTSLQYCVRIFPPQSRCLTTTTTSPSTVPMLGPNHRSDLQHFQHQQTTESDYHEFLILLFFLLVSKHVS